MKSYSNFGFVAILAVALASVPLFAHGGGHGGGGHGGGGHGGGGHGGGGHSGGGHMGGGHSGGGHFGGGHGGGHIGGGHIGGGHYSGGHIGGGHIGGGHIGGGHYSGGATYHHGGGYTHPGYGHGYGHGYGYGHGNYGYGYGRPGYGYGYAGYGGAYRYNAIIAPYCTRFPWPAARYTYYRTWINPGFVSTAATPAYLCIASAPYEFESHLVGPWNIPGHSTVAWSYNWNGAWTGAVAACEANHPGSGCRVTYCLNW